MFLESSWICWRTSVLKVCWCFLQDKPDSDPGVVPPGDKQQGDKEEVLPRPRPPPPPPPPKPSSVTEGRPLTPSTGKPPPQSTTAFFYRPRVWLSGNRCHPLQNPLQEATVICAAVRRHWSARPATTSLCATPATTSSTAIPPEPITRETKYQRQSKVRNVAMSLEATVRLFLSFIIFFCPCRDLQHLRHHPRRRSVLHLRPEAVSEVRHALPLSSWAQRTPEDHHHAGQDLQVRTGTWKPLLLSSSLFGSSSTSSQLEFPNMTRQQERFLILLDLFFMGPSSKEPIENVWKVWASF